MVSQLVQESLLVEVDRVSEARLHLWYLVTDDLHQHLGELHLQRLRLAKGVEAEVQQVPHELHDTHKHTGFYNQASNQRARPSIHPSSTLHPPG